MLQKAKQTLPTPQGISNSFPCLRIREPSLLHLNGALLVQIVSHTLFHWVCPVSSAPGWKSYEGKHPLQQLQPVTGNGRPSPKCSPTPASSPTLLPSAFKNDNVRDIDEADDNVNGDNWHLTLTLSHALQTLCRHYYFTQPSQRS